MFLESSQTTVLGNWLITITVIISIWTSFIKKKINKKSEWLSGKQWQHKLIMSSD